MFLIQQILTKAERNTESWPFMKGMRPLSKYGQTHVVEHEMKL